MKCLKGKDKRKGKEESEDQSKKHDDKRKGKEKRNADGMEDKENSEHHLEKDDHEKCEGNKRAAQIYEGISSKKSRKTVLDLPPCQYNKETFIMNNPFVKVQETSEYSISMPDDKVGDGKEMKPAALREAVIKMLHTPALASSAYKQPRTENGGRIIHGALVLDLWSLTRPSVPKSLTMADLMESERTTGVFDRNICEDNSDLHIKIGESKKDKDNESVDSLTVRHEGEDPEKPNSSKRHDFVFLVNDHRIKDIDQKVVVLVVECGWANSLENKIYQAAGYVSKKYGVRNMTKGRFDPIYLQCWGDKSWSYGIFYVFGIVKIFNGEVISTTRSSVKKQQEIFLKATRELQIMTKDAGACFRDGEYVDGFLYVPHEKKFQLPDFTIVGGVSAGGKLFFQALMRIVIGEVVLGWEKEDVVAAFSLRDQMVLDKITKAWET